MPRGRSCGSQRDHRRPRRAVVQAGTIHGDVIIVGSPDARLAYRSFLRSSLASRADLCRGWLAVAAASPSEHVPASVADVNAGIMELLNQLRELCLTSPQPIITAARAAYEEMLAPANGQFNLHCQNFGSPLWLSSLDKTAFQLHTARVDGAIDCFIVTASTMARK